MMPRDHQSQARPYFPAALSRLVNTSGAIYSGVPTGRRESTYDEQEGKLLSLIHNMTLRDVIELNMLYSCVTDAIDTIHEACRCKCGCGCRFVNGVPGMSNDCSLQTEHEKL